MLSLHVIACLVSAKISIECSKPTGTYVTMNQAINQATGVKVEKVIKVIGIVVVIMVLIYWLFSDRLIRELLEHELTQQYGAEVTIGALSHRLLPLRVNLQDVQATDPKKPNQNLIDIQMLSAQVAWQPLLSNQVIIDTLEITGVRFATERETAGEVLRPPPHDATFNQIKQQIPSIEQLISRAPLRSPQVTRELSASIEQVQQLPVAEIKERISAQTLTEYKQDLAALKNEEVSSASDVGKLIKQVQTLTQRLIDDRSVIRSFISQANTAKQQLDNKYQELGRAITEDTQLVSSLWAGDQNDIESVLTAIFADQASEVIAAYRKLMNLLSDQKRSEIPFDQRQMTFWVKNLKATSQVLNREVRLDAQNITDFHPQLGLSTEYQVVSVHPESQQQVFRLSGQLAVIESGLDAQTDWQIIQASLPVTELRLPSSKEPFAMTLLEGLLSSHGQVTIRGELMDGTCDIQLSQLDVQQPQSNDRFQDNAKISLLANMLSRLNGMNLSTSFSGTVAAPVVSISSDVFAQVEGALASAVVKDPQLHQQIRVKLLEQLPLQYKELVKRDELARLTKLLAELQSNEKQLELLIKQAIQSNIRGRPDKLLEDLKGLFD